MAFRLWPVCPFPRPGLFRAISKLRAGMADGVRVAGEPSLARLRRVAYALPPQVRNEEAGGTGG